MVEDDGDTDEREVDLENDKVNLKEKSGKERENSNKIQGKVNCQRLTKNVKEM